MTSFQRTRNFCDYLAGGFACGIGGMALVCVPLIGVPMLWSLLHDWFKRQGIADITAATWFWSKVVALIGPRSLDFLFPVVLFGLPVAGFVYGWWAGMHGKQTATLKT
jgi:hypothetical protein